MRIGVRICKYRGYGAPPANWVRSALSRLHLTFRDVPRHFATRVRNQMGSFCAFANGWGKTVHLGAFRGIWVRFAHPRNWLHEVAWGCTGTPVVRPHSSACGVADRCVLIRDAASGKARENSAPSTTPRSCAIVTTIAHDKIANPRKAPEIR